MTNPCRLIGGCLSAALVAACAGGGLSSSTPASASAQLGAHRVRGALATVTYLHSFAGSPDDGANPLGRLDNVGGTLYGTTHWGGTSRYDGTVYSITPSGSESVIHFFGKGADGSQPYAGVVDVNGTLYGSTQFGGDAAAGTVYSITPSGSEKVLHSFYVGSAGSHPIAGLVAVGGELYGTTASGGLNNVGIVFKMTTSGVETVLHNFGGSGDGDDPTSRLLNIGEMLYGTTYAGGRVGLGTVFAVTTSGQETVLHSFGIGYDGRHPVYGRLVNVGGTLYGTTKDGGGNGNGYGTVYSIAPTPSGTYTVVHSFEGGSDGCHPEAGLVLYKGLLYGTTGGCGAYDAGTIFAIDPSSNTLTTIWAFGDQPAGRHPASDLKVVGDTIYGTTVDGGTHNFGTVFSFKP